MRKEKIILRSYPKAIFLYPLFIVTGLILIYELIINPNLNLDIPPEDIDNYIGISWLVALFFCLFIISIQVKLSKLCLVLFAGITISVILFFSPIGGSFVALITNVGILELALPFHFYLLVFLILAIILFFMWVGARIKFVRIERNEIWCMSGIAGKTKERFPTRSLEINVERPDFLEYWLGTGRVTLKIPSLNKYIQLDTVFRAGTKVKQIDNLLSAIRVDESGTQAYSTV